MDPCSEGDGEKGEEEGGGHDVALGTAASSLEALSIDGKVATFTTPEHPEGERPQTGRYRRGPPMPEECFSGDDCARNNQPRKRRSLIGAVMHRQRRTNRRRTRIFESACDSSPNTCVRRTALRVSMMEGKTRRDKLRERL